MRKEQQYKAKLFTTGYLFLILISLTTAMSYSMISTLITNYAVKLGGTLAMAGTIAGIFSMAALFSRPVGGLICDTLNKKKICIIATVVFCFSFLGYAFSANMAVMLFFQDYTGIFFWYQRYCQYGLSCRNYPKRKIGRRPWIFWTGPGGFTGNWTGYRCCDEGTYGLPGTFLYRGGYIRFCRCFVVFVPIR